MNLEEIKDLIKLVSKSGLGKVEIEREGFRISIKGSQSEQVLVQAAPVMAAPAPIAAAPVAAPSNTGDAAPVAASDDSKYITVKSPMIGTLYRKPAPDKPMFVEVGSTISKGDVVCVVEAMKLFNEIESEISGKIVKVLVDDSSPVEFDQPLFLVDPS